MASELNQLIDYYLGEKQRVLTAIQEHLRQEDYLAAHYDSRALWQIERELTALMTLKIPNYPEIRLREHIIQNMLVDISDDPKADMDNRKFKEGERQKLQRKIEKLKGKTSENRAETQLLDNAIYDLVEKRSRGIRLFPIKSTTTSCIWNA